jgi:urease accessory protein
MIAEKSQRPATEQIELVAERGMFLKRRWRGAAANGTEFGFDLETRLIDGCVFHQTDSHDYVIRQEMETVYQLSPATADDAALMGWNIGNLHFPVQITDGAIRVTRDPAIQQLIEREGWAFNEVSVVFNPLRVTAHAS